MGILGLSGKPFWQTTWYGMNASLNGFRNYIEQNPVRAGWWGNLRISVVLGRADLDVPQAWRPAPLVYNHCAILLK